MKSPQSCGINLTAGTALGHNSSPRRQSQPQTLSLRTAFPHPPIPFGRPAAAPTSRPHALPPPPPPPPRISSNFGLSSTIEDQPAAGTPRRRPREEKESFKSHFKLCRNPTLTSSPHPTDRCSGLHVRAGPGEAGVPLSPLRKNPSPS